MIRHLRGNILDSEADVIVIPVNTVGVMGAGLAKAAADGCPGLLGKYRRWCAAQRRHGGDVALWDCLAVLATKEHWRDTSRLEWVERGLEGLIDLTRPDESLALPMLGCGLGGLRESQVLPLIEARFAEGERLVEVWRP